MGKRLAVEFLKEDCPMFSRALVAPWTVRALVYRRWKWLVGAFAAMWLSIDGVYSLYWWCRGFDALQTFRGANAFYCRSTSRWDLR